MLLRREGTVAFVGISRPLLSLRSLSSSSRKNWTRQSLGSVQTCSRRMHLLEQGSYSGLPYTQDVSHRVGSKAQPAEAENCFQG